MLISLRKKQCSKINKLAFTLAEVLIVLGIIGIVAEITIPTLYNDFHKQEYTTSLKKVYTIFNEALVQIANDMGCVGDLACTGLFDSTSVSLQAFGDAVSSYFRVSKNCGITTSTGCFSDSVAPNYDGSGTKTANYSTNSTYYRFITVDGFSFAIATLGDNCGNTTFGVNSMSRVCGQVLIDVNGLKGPNSQGRDIFAFYITNGKGPLIYPRGGRDHIPNGVSKYWKDTGTCTPTDPGGLFCAGRIIDESWQMNY